MSEIIEIRAVALRYRADDAPRLLDGLRRTRDALDNLDSMHLTRRSEWAAARSAVDRLISDSGSSAILRMNSDHGYPELWDHSEKNRLDSYVSWSHTTGFVVAAMHSSPIGVDIEREDRNVEKVLDRISSEEERALLPGDWIVDGHSTSARLGLWCAKEAAAKATGLGMRFGLMNFRVTPSRGTEWKVDVGVPGPRLLKGPGVAFYRRDEFLVAVCYEQDQRKMVPKWL